MAARTGKKAKSGSGDGPKTSSRVTTKKQANVEDARYNVGWWIVVVILFIGISAIHRDHVYSLFEGDKHFSHLSNLEREMAFRTEMGLYYSYFKTIIHAPSFANGILQITQDNVTEYPDTINTLKRFNLYPEVVLGAMYRTYSSIADSMQWKTKICWQVNRGEGKKPVPSCEGLGEPTYFYVHNVMNLNGLMMGVYFLYGTFLSRSIFGGVITVAAYFFNHGEATRVMWTPPLRESFAFPILVVQMFYLSHMLRMRSPSLKNSLMLALLIVCFMLPWQFAQFALMTQLVAATGCYVLKYINQSKMKHILVGHAVGLISSFVLLMGNEMLLTSFYASSIITVVVILCMEKYLQKLPALVTLIIQGVTLLAGMVVFKIGLGKALQVTDDAHIGDILRSKFGDFQNFHTQLYTCAKEFDFLALETYTKLTMTGLLPAMIIVVSVVSFCLLRQLYRNWSEGTMEGVIEMEDGSTQMEHAEVVYNILQMIAFIFMAVIIMRLKLFATPQICLVISLLASREFFGWLPQLSNANTHRALIVLMIAGMAVVGIQNIQHQRSIKGEYSNYPMEDLIDWILEKTPEDAVFGGPMPTMANIKLSTGRPITNHPHYEDAGLRERTKKIYTMASRKPVDEVYNIIKSLKVQYFVYEGGWCLRGNAKTGCTMPEIWDIEDPANRDREPTCMEILKPEVAESYFQLVYRNEKFHVFRVL